MSTSFDRLIDGMIDTLRAHVLPNSADDFARGQLFSVIFALNSLKLNADWKAGPLLEQVRVQDSAFSEVRQLAVHMNHPDIPAAPRTDEGIVDPVQIEALREQGITHGWLLGESFGSQPAWALLELGEKSGFQSDCCWL